MDDIDARLAALGDKEDVGVLRVEMTKEDWERLLSQPIPPTTRTVRQVGNALVPTFLPEKPAED